MKVKMLRDSALHVYGTVVPRKGAIADLDDKVAAYLCSIGHARPAFKRDMRTASVTTPETRG